MSSTLFEKTKDQLLDQTRVPAWYKLIRVNVELRVNSELKLEAGIHLICC